MNWKLIVQLSMFGLAMAIATGFLIPSKIEPAFWLPIFLISAYLIARQCSSKLFLHGLLLGLANSVWITAVHVLLYESYIARHAQEAAMMQSMPVPVSPRLVMALTGPMFGLVFGVVLGLFALVAGKLVKNPSAPADKAAA